MNWKKVGDYIPTTKLKKAANYSVKTLKKVGNVSIKIIKGAPGFTLLFHGINEYITRKGKRPIYNLKKPEDRKALLGFPKHLAYMLLVWPIKLGIGYYVKDGISTGEWPPFKYNQKTEQVQPIQKNKLENIMYDEAVKSLEN